MNAAHWTADRQSGPVLLKVGTKAQREAWLPRIVSAEASFCIGMSELDSGSDLASLRTSGQRVDGGWQVSGTKLWTTNAHRVLCMIALIRTETSDEKNRQAGRTQLPNPLDSPGVTARPIRSMVGADDFNEVNFENVVVPDGSGLIALNLSAQLRMHCAATTPTMLARYVVLRAGERLAHHFQATGEVHHVLRGQGITRARS